MRKVLLNEPIDRNGNYILFFHEKLRFEFSNKRKCLDFNNYFQKYFTNELVTINKLYLDLYVISRNQYFVNDSIMNLKTSFEFIEENIDYLLKSTLSENHNYFVLNKLRASLIELYLIKDRLIDNAKKRSDTSLMYALNSIESIINDKLVLHRELPLKMKNVKKNIENGMNNVNLKKLIKNNGFDYIAIA